MKTHTNHYYCIQQGLKCVFRSLESMKEDKSMYSIIYGQVKNITKHQWLKVKIKEIWFGGDQSLTSSSSF